MARVKTISLGIWKIPQQVTPESKQPGAEAEPRHGNTIRGRKKEKSEGGSLLVISKCKEWEKEEGQNVCPACHLGIVWKEEGKAFGRQKLKPFSEGANDYDDGKGKTRREILFRTSSCWGKNLGVDGRDEGPPTNRLICAQEEGCTRLTGEKSRRNQTDKASSVVRPRNGKNFSEGGVEGYQEDLQQEKLEKGMQYLSCEETTKGADRLGGDGVS